MKNLITMNVQQAKDMEFRLETNARNQQASLDDLLAQRQVRVSLRHSIKQYDSAKHGGIALQVNSHHVGIANALYGTARGMQDAVAEFKQHDRKIKRHADFGRRQGEKRMKALAVQVADAE
jgi:hypothetical protein